MAEGDYSDPASSATESAFMAGVTLVAEMIERAAQIHPDSAELRAEYREGRPQARFCRDYLERLMREPELMAGFDAALSSVLRLGYAFTIKGAPEEMRSLSYADCVTPEESAS